MLADCKIIARSYRVLLWNMFDGSIVQGGWLGNTAKDHGGTGLLLVLSILLALSILLV
ncbi:hypothetical protein [Methanosarcina mazei]|uniref:hypothetical protein n=1 Tax=Methanosarcina mazei TaxID=2209 RepID=UPI0012D419B4|nr:hypothetical protein [Methanosarcina mazei]MDO5839691.1 hypothetical protein [Methanosarcina mazei]